MATDETGSIERSEEIIDPGTDLKQDMLDLLAGGEPWVFVVADTEAEGGAVLRVNAGGAVHSSDDIRRILARAVTLLDG